MQAAFDSGAAIEDDGLESAFELIGELQETVKNGVWVGDCFIFTNAGKMVTGAFGVVVACGALLFSVPMMCTPERLQQTA